MGKCLVTKLNGSSNNSELMRLGEMRIKIAKVDNPTDATQGFGIDVNKPVTLEIIGDGYFTDKTLTENKGKNITLNAGSNGVWVSNDNVEIAVLDKYSITTITKYYPGQTSTGYTENISLNIEDLKYSTALNNLELYNTQITGDISALKNLTALNNLKLYNTQITGDISALKNLTALNNLNLYNTQITGDISALKNLTALNNLKLATTKVSGDISTLKNLTALNNLELYNTQITGDISALKNLTTLVHLDLYNTQVPLTGDIGELSSLVKGEDIRLDYGKFTGDLATLPFICKFVSFSNDKGSVFTWGTRPSSANIIASNIRANLTNIDKMLQDQAQCQVGFSSSDPASYKTIQVAGNRTSASDDAVAALQQKGYTISIAKA